MTNEIQNVREAIECGLATAQLCQDGSYTEVSPCGRYSLLLKTYVTETGTDFFTVAVVHRTDNEQVVATIKRNDSRCFYGWVSAAGHDYLLFAEDLEGQSIVDLTMGRVIGYSSPEDPFIWTEFHPSPARTKLAVIGCYWACP